MSGVRAGTAPRALWEPLRAAASAFCPPFEIAEEDPGRLLLRLREPRSRDELLVRYRSERGLFLRTYFLRIETEVPGAGPAEAGELVVRRRRLRWRRPRPSGARKWQQALDSGEFRDARRRLQVERLTLRWEPGRSSWRLALETLSGALIVTFFPPLTTPNPFKPEEADAVLRLLDAVRAAVR